ncbi:MAG: PHP domain-containing protein [Thermodesulfobacteriota bacterium]|jgi:hypothetical protein
MKALAELHCHTTFSDGFGSPETCIAWARGKGLQVIAITDHNTAEGALPYWEKSYHEGIIVIPGEEVGTELGHVLVYFIRKTIQPGLFEEVIMEVKDQGAIAFLAHPYRIPLGKIWRKRPICKLNKGHFKHLQGLEIENGRNRPRGNRLAHYLAEEKKLPAISGSDAHFLFEIGNNRTELEISQLSLEAVQTAMTQGKLRPFPRRFNTYGLGLLVALRNRLSNHRYEYRSSGSTG